MIEHVNLYKRKIVEKRTIFITLTYPGAYPAASEAKRHLDNLIKRLRRKFPQAGGVWRLEWQERGAPHFHLLVFGIRFIPWQWVAQAWYEVCGEASPEHLKAGTETRQARSRKQALFYLSKYLAKTTQAQPPDGSPPVGLAMSPEQIASCVAPGVSLPGGPVVNLDALKSRGQGSQEQEEGPGRLWGHWGEWRNYQSEVVEFRLDASEVARVARTVDKMRQAEYRREDGTRSRKRVKRRKFLDRHARWFVNASELWRAIPYLVLGRVVQAIAAQAGPVSRPRPRLPSDGARDRRAFDQAFGLFFGVSRFLAGGRLRRWSLVGRLQNEQVKQAPARRREVELPGLLAPS